MKMDMSKIGKKVKEVVKIANSLTTKKIRVAVLGAKFAGKTVLLSAIDRYLQELEDNERKLNKEGECKEGGWQLTELQDISNRRHGEWSVFSKKDYQREMAKCDWPKRTSIPAFLAYKLEFANKGTIRKYEIELLDIPGERVADVVTMWNSSYEEWSDKAEKEYKKINKKWCDEYFEYLKELKTSEVDSDAILKKYKKFLSKHLSQFAFFVTPSEAILDRNGNPIDEKNLTENSDCDAWVSEMNDIKFAPITSELCDDERFRECVKGFKKEYIKYKKAAQIDAIKKWCITSDKVYYLVDVLGALEKAEMGVKSTKGQVRLATVCVANRSFFSPKLRSFYAVATQVDRCILGGSENDSENKNKDNKKNIAAWIKEYFTKTEVFKDGVFKELTVAAVASATINEDGSKFEGKNGFMKNPNKPFSKENQHDGDYTPMPVPSVAEAIRNEYKGYDWGIPFPCFPKDRNSCLEHYNLDKIVASILDLS